ncbi:MAG: nucleoside recognition domain-containing protein [Pseudomonadota bacterium]
MNAVFLALVVLAFATAAGQEWAGSAASMAALSTGMLTSAKGAIDLALGLAGIMALFLGLMKVAEAAGLLRVLARLLRPLMTRLFPEVPPDHPAMGAMILNLSSNLLGLGNAATPFGIRAMQALDRLNPYRGVASDPMVLFLGLNTAGIALLPSSIMALRSAAGSANPAAILPTTLFATLCATLVAIIAAKTLGRFYPVRAGDAPSTASIPTTVERTDDEPQDAGSYPLWVSLLALFTLLALPPLWIWQGKAVSAWILPGLMLSILLLGALRQVRIYESFVEGAAEGFQVAVRIIPYLVAILVAVGMLRASGALDWLVTILGSWIGPLGLPAEVLPLALLRPFSGSGAYGLLAAILNNPATGPDTYAGLLASTLQGSTETTFYVLAVYFGAVEIRTLRHAIFTGLLADLAALIGAVVACQWLV